MIRIFSGHIQRARRLFSLLLLLAPLLALPGETKGAEPTPLISISFAPDTPLSIRLRAREDSTVVRLDYGHGTPEERLIWDSYSDVEVKPQPKGGIVRIYGRVAGLDCSSAPKAIRALEVSKCPSLEELNVEGCQLAALDLSGNPELEELECASNRLSTLDLSACRALRYLDCHSNNISELKVSSSDSLRYLDCSENVLKNIDLSRSAALQTLYCQNNQLATLELRTNWKVYQLACFGNNLSPLAIETLLRGLHIAPVGRQGVIYLDAIPSESMTHSLRMTLELARRKRWRVDYSGVVRGD
ncbi:MAG: hypothetical protein CSA07_05495 [Bacteroidia bacterium]|nr:MAG: hypothetical protein CSA07_05495 [Bacteroidia bacterium]